MNYEHNLRLLRDLYDDGRFANDYYKAIIPSRDFLVSYEEFTKLPFMHKESLRRYSAYERVADPRNKWYGIFSSSGSTGERTYYVYSKSDKVIHEKCVRNFFTEIGITSNDLGAILAPVDTTVIAHTMMWQYTTMGASYVNCPDPTPKNIVDLVSSLPVTVLSGRPDSLSSVGLSEEFVRKARASSVRLLLPGGGFLSEMRRQYLQKIWDADCYNILGMSEIFGPLAVECKCKNGQHFPSEYVMIEILDPHTLMPVSDGEIGYAVYTTLWDKGFPLVRYWSDDLMRVETSHCTCGSDNGRLYFCGRTYDSMKFGNKRIFPIDFENIIMPYGFVMDFKAIIDGGSISVKLETLDTKQKLSTNLLAAINDFFGINCSIELVTPGSLRMMNDHARHFIGNMEV